MFSTALLALAISATGALAQSATESSSAAEPTTSLPAITQCVIGCIQPAAQAIGCEFTEALCVCNSIEFIPQASQCLSTQCPEEDLEAALDFQRQLCAVNSSGSVIDSSTSSLHSTPATTFAATSNTAQTITRATFSTSTATSNTAQTTIRATSTTSTATSSTAQTTTSIDPNSSTSRLATSSASSPAATTVNAALGTKGSMGLVALRVAGILGLVL